MTPQTPPRQVGSIDFDLAVARSCVQAARDAEAREAYLAVLRRDPAHLAALSELAALACAGGHRSAARTLCEQAARCHPDSASALIGLGNLFIEDEALAAARDAFVAALAIDPECAEAHQGLARSLTELGEVAAAEPHWHKGFVGHAVILRPHRGEATPVRVLLLVAARGGNIPTAAFLDDRLFDVTIVYADFHDPADDLPLHAVILNAIGDADLCPAALAGAEAIVGRTTAPLVNPPALVRRTGRLANARRLGGISGVRAPRVESLSRAAILSRAGWEFPLLLRAPGFHTGRHFRRIDGAEELAPALAALPGEELLAISYLDARGADGLARKYRVMIVDGVLHPLHLAIAEDWKVHYFTAGMAADPARREEERRFLEDMPAVLGPRAMAALAGIGETLGLDYAGIDFGLAADGSVLLFEANAAMVVHPPDADPTWDYRRAAVGRVLDAVRRMLLARAATASPSR